jgi:hypothetical protein
MKGPFFLRKPLFSPLNYGDKNLRKGYRDELRSSKSPRHIARTRPPIGDPGTTRRRVYAPPGASTSEAVASTASNGNSSPCEKQSD